jgi:hypothetical protein
MEIVLIATNNRKHKTDGENTMCVNKIIAVVCLLGLSSHTLATDTWSEADKYREATYLTFHTLDWAQTRYISKHSEYYEINPILGEHPSTQKVDTYFVLTGLGHVAITHYLPSKYRSVWQWSTIALEAALVIHNKRIGIQFDF